MKRLLLLLAFVIISANSFAQSLGLDDLVKIMKLSPTETNEYLTEKRWELSGSENTDAEEGTLITWAYNMDGESAEKWLNLAYDKREIIRNRTESGGMTKVVLGSGVFNKNLTYTTTSDADLKTIKDKIKQYDMANIKSQAIENGFINMYMGQNYVVGIATERVPGAELRYIISVFSKDLYNKLKEEQYTSTSVSE